MKGETEDEPEPRRTRSMGRPGNRFAEELGKRLFTGARQVKQSGKVDAGMVHVAHDSD